MLFIYFIILYSGVITAVMYLCFVVIPEITQGPIDMARQLGENVNFTCNATGVPLPDITWSSDSSSNIMDEGDIMILDSTDALMRESRLIIMNLKAADFQNYTCNATNMFGSNSETALLGSEYANNVVLLA